MCSCVAEASCDSESLGVSVSSMPELAGPSGGSGELSEAEKGSGLEEPPKSAGTPLERRALAACVLSLHLDFCTN